jgi:hypothetical protein
VLGVDDICVLLECCLEVLVLVICCMELLSLVVIVVVVSVRSVTAAANAVLQLRPHKWAAHVACSMTA